MALKRIIIANIIISILVIVFFYYNFDLLAKRSIPIHITLVAYGIYFLIFCGILSTKFLPKKLSSILVSGLFIVGQLFLLSMYAGYYFGVETWGYPLTLEVSKTYVHEIKNMSGKLPVGDHIFILIILLIVAIAIAPILYTSKQITETLRRKSSTFLSAKNISLGVILFLICPIIFVNSRDVQVRVNYNDPILTFFLYDYSAQGTSINSTGQENTEEMLRYPNNLSFNKKNVIIIICDALRSDHISGYGYDRKTTPFLDSIITLENSIKVDHFFSSSSRSFVGISNTLSSDRKIAYQNFFIHDLLNKQGYEINFILGGDHTTFFGLKQHYGKNLDLYHDGISAWMENSEVSVNDDMEIILKSLKRFHSFESKPAFFYFHFMSVHNLGLFDKNYIHFKPSTFSSFGQSTPPDILVNDYDNRILQMDDYLRQTFSILEEKGYLDNAIVAITADHGQSLGERGKVGHVNSVYPGEIRIPFILMETGSNQKTRSTKLIFGNHLNIAPSIVDLLGIPIPKTWDGHSVFDKDQADIIFQNEKDFFSCIWYEKNKLYQFVYNSKTQSKELFDVYSAKNQYTNIIEQHNYDELELQISQLESFYNITIN